MIDIAKLKKKSVKKLTKSESRILFEYNRDTKRSELINNNISSILDKIESRIKDLYIMIKSNEDGILVNDLIIEYNYIKESHKRLNLSGEKNKI